jgi:molybdenum-dependent DNA-binding transcriptional regulator ModE
VGEGDLWRLPSERLIRGGFLGRTGGGGEGEEEVGEEVLRLLEEGLAERVEEAIEVARDLVVMVLREALEERRRRRFRRARHNLCMRTIANKNHN